jgi:hypothetical protein
MVAVVQDGLGDRNKVAAGRLLRASVRSAENCCWKFPAEGCVADFSQRFKHPIHPDGFARPANFLADISSLTAEP